MKTPVEYVVGTVRALRVGAAVPGLGAVAGLGQIPFVPPDVGGWPTNAAWLSTSSAQVRLQFALAVAAAADVAPIDEAAPARDRGGRAPARRRRVGPDTTAPRSRRSPPSRADCSPLALVAPEYLSA